MTVMLLIVFVPILVGGLIGAILSPYIERAKVRGEARSEIEAEKRRARVVAEIRRLKDEQNTK